MKYNRYVFLDIDGVLCLKEYKKHEKSIVAFDEKSMNRFNKLIEYTNAYIVITSSWRNNNDIDHIKSVLRLRNFLYPEKICGQTIRAHEYVKNIHLKIPRGVEIKQYIDTNILNKSAFKYIIIDDKSDILLEQRNNLVKTNPKKGFTFYKYLIALYKLKYQ